MGIGDEAEVKKREKRDQFGRESELSDLRELLSKPSGRRVIWGYLSLCGLFKTSFSTNALTMAFNEGQRDIALKILTDVMEAGPQFYAKMQEEASLEEQNNE